MKKIINTYVREFSVQNGPDFYTEFRKIYETEDGKFFKKGRDGSMIEVFIKKEE